MRNDILLSDMIYAYSEALTIIDRRLSDHNMQVAYIAYEIAAAMGYSDERIKEVIIAGLLHDVGAFREREIDRMLEYETDSETLLMNHTIIGYFILREYPYFRNVADIVRYHHRAWENGKGEYHGKEKIPEESQIIFAADRLAILVTSDTMKKGFHKDIPELIKKITDRIGVEFKPSVADALYRASRPHSFWFNIYHKYKKRIIHEWLRKNDKIIDRDEIENLCRIFVYTVDFRSRFTASHSFGVAATAEKIGSIIGFSEENMHNLRIAGYLHDIGKLVIPVEILEKKGPLNDAEAALMKQHTYYTYFLLNYIKGFEKIRDIAAYHHEKLNGSGYPFCITKDELSKEARIMAVADIFTALTENRPYREGMKQKQTTEILGRMVEEGLIDKEITEIAVSNYNEILEHNLVAQMKIRYEFELADSVLHWFKP